MPNKIILKILFYLININSNLYTEAHNITEKLHLDKGNFLNQKTWPVLRSDKENISWISQIIMEGLLEDENNLTSHDILLAINISKEVNIPPANLKKMLEKLKENVSVSNFTLKQFINLGEHLADVSDNDLFIINIENEDIVKYLGTTSFLSRHQTSIISSAIKNTKGIKILLNDTALNIMKGLLCGFDKKDIIYIPNEIFRNINKDVFENLHRCTLEQLRLMFQKICAPSVFGPPQTWDAETVLKIGMLFLAITKQELKTIRPKAMEKLPENIVHLMSFDQIFTLTKEQATHLNKYAYEEYIRRMYLQINRSNVKSPKIALILALSYIVNINKLLY